MHQEEYPCFQPVDDWVMVWIGDLPPNEMEEYMHEPGNADKVDYGDPISQFGRDLGQWYDHDFIKVESSNHPMSIEEICEANGIEDIELIDEIKQRSGDTNVRSLLILWNARATPGSKRHTFAKGRLRLVGSWPHVSPLKD